jgi:hypothetical protein
MMKRLPEKFKVVSDSGWTYNEASSIPSRGINDYYRVIKFQQNPTLDELKEIREWLEANECPGWTRVTANKIGSCHFEFHTTYDSSD